MTKFDKLVNTNSNGMACVCFRNRDGLSLAQITEIFSEHGNVVSINCAGDDRGFRFVRFREKEEALKCAIAMDGHPSIRLQQVRPKNKDPTESNENHLQDRLTKNKRDNIRLQNNEQIADYVEQTDKANSTKGSVSSRKSKTNNFWRKNTDNQFQRDHSSKGNKDGEASKKNLNTQQYATNNQNSIANRLNLRSVQNFSSPNNYEDRNGEIQNQNDSMDAAKLASTFQVPGNDVTINSPALTGGPISSQIIVNQPPSNHFRRGQSVVTDLPPPLVVPSLHSDRRNIREEKIKVVLASDVIVANIHANIGVSNIYQMFKKFSPIYVSDIETVPEINVRFCYAYFETPNDAMEVEQSFDGLSVLGQNLITLRSQRLEAVTGIF